MPAYEWLTVTEVAAELRLGRSTVADKAARNKLPATKIDGVWRFRRDLLDAYLASRTRLPRAVVEQQERDRRVVSQQPAGIKAIFEHRPWANRGTAARRAGGSEGGQP